MSSFYGPADALGAISKAISDYYGGMLESERRMLPMQEQAQRMGEAERTENRTQQQFPLEIQGQQTDIQYKQAQIEAEKKRSALQGKQSITDRFGNVYEYDQSTGQIKPILSGQSTSTISGGKQYKETPQGLTAQDLPITPAEVEAGNELKTKFQMMRTPQDRLKFLENWITKYYQHLDKNSPVIMLYNTLMREVSAQIRATATGSNTTTQETSTPAHVITDPYQRQAIFESSIRPLLDRGPQGTGRSKMDELFPGFDNPSMPAKMKERFIENVLGQMGYDAKVMWTGKDWALGRIATQGEITGRVTTKTPNLPAPSIDITE